MALINQSQRQELIYPELSYQIMGILFEVHNKLGTKYQEKHYQRAIEIKLRSCNISFKREVKMAVEFEGVKIGDFYADFIIEDKIILETKTILNLSLDDVKQVLRYLEATQLKLGILANFKQPRLQYKRVVL